VARRVRRGAGAGRRVKKRLLYVHSRKASFVAIDRAILAERFEIEDLYQPGRWPNPLKIVIPAPSRDPGALNSFCCTAHHVRNDGPQQ
jgi:hypothetical protein